MSHQIFIEKDLRALFGQARNQEDRPTCLAFAASDAHASRMPHWLPLSCEFAFFHSQRRSNRGPNDGAVLPAMLSTIEIDGQPAEGGWPYLETLPPDIASWVPPVSPGPLFHRNSDATLLDFDEICRSIDADNAPIILMTLSNSFYYADADGVFNLKPGEMPQAAVRHAMVAVAYGVINNEPAILARNSWGADWGNGGHVWLPKSFVKLGLFGTATMGGEI